MRKDRVAQTKKILEVSMPINYEKAVALISMNVGISNKTAREYISSIVQFNGWEIKDEIIQKPIKVEVTDDDQVINH